MAETLFTALERTAQADPGKPALIYRDREISFGAFLQRVRANAVRITQQAQCSGPAALLLPDGPDFLIAFFAGLAAGRPAFVLDPASPPHVLETLLQRAAPAVIVGGRGLTSGPATENANVIAVTHDDDALASPLPTGDPDSEFYWGLTSGTTGAFKVFARTHRSWLETFRIAEAVFDFTPADRIGIIGSLSHSLFLYGSVHALCRGMTVVLSTPFRPGRAVRELVRHGATVVYAVPAMLDALLKSDLPDAAHGLRRIFSSGAKLSESSRAALEEAFPGVDIAETYGASELSYVSYVSTRAPAPAGSVGRLFPEVRLEIRERDGAAKSPQSEGIIWVASPMLFSRYVDDAPHAGPVTGWASAGDIGSLAPGGFLRLAGRANRTINSKGLKIQPEIIEEALLLRPDVSQAAVIGLDDRKRGQMVAAIIVPTKGTGLKSRDLRAFCRERLGARIMPHAFFLARDLPMTRSGKVAVNELRAAIERGDPAYREIE